MDTGRKFLCPGALGKGPKISIPHMANDHGEVMGMWLFGGLLDQVSMLMTLKTFLNKI